MKVTRDVITDLLPLYASGEASADTRALVDDYLRANPDFAATVNAAAEDRTDALLTASSNGLPESTERAALERSRSILRRRSWAMGLAFFFTLLPFTIVHTDTIRFLMIRDEPRSALLLIVAACLWIYYYRLNRRLTGTGL
jgi:anti-sigma factor RsiW